MGREGRPVNVIVRYRHPSRRGVRFTGLGRVVYLTLIFNFYFVCTWRASEPDESGERGIGFHGYIR